MPPTSLMRDISACMWRIVAILLSLPMIASQDACLAKQSMDNMSVVLIAFKAAWEEGTIERGIKYMLLLPVS